MRRYILEATLYNGDRLFSDEVERESAPNATTHVVQHLRGQTMVESVTAIDVSTGEVVLDLPSWPCLARVRASAA